MDRSHQKSEAYSFCCPEAVWIDKEAQSAIDSWFPLHPNPNHSPALVRHNSADQTKRSLTPSGPPSDLDLARANTCFSGMEGWSGMQGSMSGRQ